MAGFTSARAQVPGIITYQGRVGPFRTTVAQAVGASPSGSRLYIRGGNYDETILLNKPMTARRYDYYDTAGSVLIGH